MFAMSYWFMPHKNILYHTSTRSMMAFIWIIVVILSACEDSQSVTSELQPSGTIVDVDLYSSDIRTDMNHITHDQMLHTDIDPVDLAWSDDWPNTDSFSYDTDAMAHQCFALEVSHPSLYEPWVLVLNEETAEGYEWRNKQRVLSESAPATLARFYMQASDLSTYLLLDQNTKYLEWSNDIVQATTQLSVGSSLILQKDLVTANSVGEWEVQRHGYRSSTFQLWNRGHQKLLSTTIMPADFREVHNDQQALVVSFIPQDNCTTSAELSIDADGQVTRTHFDNGDLFGVVDAHSHIFSNIGFGPGLHGAPFHPLGVTHALNDCDVVHGEDGRKDLWGYYSRNTENLDTQSLLSGLVDKKTPEFNHTTDGYPTFTSWPNAPFSDTHQTQYYRWLERAWLGGLRLMVMHAVSNEVVCQLQSYVQDDPSAYNCNEMDNVEASLRATYGMQRYIDAQMGGKDKGFLRVVTSASQARSVIAEGKLAIVLGIETSNLFNCYSTIRDERPTCDDDYLQSQFDKYYEIGVRVLFPVHKFDNGFASGDGHRGIIELANFINSGQWSSYTQECDIEARSVFDKGDIIFGGLNKEREDYGTEPAVDILDFMMNPLTSLLPYIEEITGGRLTGNWCQSHGLTPIGQSLLQKMMLKGMLIELDHFSRRAYQDAFELLADWQYPGALGTHGNTFNGQLYELGGLSAVSLGRCHDRENPNAVLRKLEDHLALLDQANRYLAEGFAFDLNGFAGYPKPRFGPNSTCSQAQENPITYPFSSWSGEINFNQPNLAQRTVDFNQEGFVHIGLLPELIQDARLAGIEDESLTPIFKSAEAYLRVWEAAEARSEVLRTQNP